MAVAITETRPLIVIGYGPRCIPVVELTKVAGYWCDILWLIDESIPEMREISSLLNRIGSVINIDGLDQDDIARVVSSPRRPKGLVTFLDKNMVVFAGVAQILGLPFHSVDTARALTDKAYQRLRLAAADIPTPVCQVVDPSDMVHGHVTAAPDVGWPAVLKPRSSQGSHYTFLVKDARELNSLAGLIGTNCPEMVLESYILDDPARRDGPFASYVSVESVVAHGRVSHLALTGRFPVAENFRETGFFIPAILGPQDQSEAIELAESAIAALGIRVGSLHTEIKFTHEGARVVEVNGRLGGGVPEMLALAAGIDLLDITLRVALGEHFVVNGPLATRRIGYRFFLQPPPVSATISSIEALDSLSDFPGVDSISVHQRPGDEVDWKDGSRNYVLSVLGSASEYSQVLEVSRIINEVIKVSYINISHN